MEKAGSNPVSIEQSLRGIMKSKIDRMNTRQKVEGLAQDLFGINPTFSHEIFLTDENTVDGYGDYEVRISNSSNSKVVAFVVRAFNDSGDFELLEGEDFRETTHHKILLHLLAQEVLTLVEN